MRRTLLRSGHEVSDEIDGERKDDRRVLLRADARQRLQVTKLQSNRSNGKGTIERETREHSLTS